MKINKMVVTVDTRALVGEGVSLSIGVGVLIVGVFCVILIYRRPGTQLGLSDGKLLSYS